MTDKELRERLDEMALEHEVSIRLHDRVIRELSEKMDSLPWKFAGITIVLIGLFVGLMKLFP